jgi:hypothetical protein
VLYLYSTVGVHPKNFCPQAKSFRALILHVWGKQGDEKVSHGTDEETDCHNLKPPCLPRVKEQQPRKLFGWMTCDFTKSFKSITWNDVILTSFPTRLTEKVREFETVRDMGFSCIGMSTWSVGKCRLIFMKKIVMWTSKLDFMSNLPTKINPSLARHAECGHEPNV